jgi:hypothetical protein
LPPTTIHITVVRSNYTLMHKPLVKVNGGPLQQKECPAYQFLRCLKLAGFADEQLRRASEELERNGSTVLESEVLAPADLESIISQCCEARGSLREMVVALLWQSGRDLDVDEVMDGLDKTVGDITEHMDPRSTPRAEIQMALESLAADHIVDKRVGGGAVRYGLKIRQPPAPHSLAALLSVVQECNQQAIPVVLACRNGHMWQTTAFPVGTARPVPDDAGVMRPARDIVYAQDKCSTCGETGKPQS